MPGWDVGEIRDGRANCPSPNVELTTRYLNGAGFSDRMFVSPSRGLRYRGKGKMDAYEEERIMTARRMARKLARNKSKKRTVRKLPQSMIIVPSNHGKRAFPIRKAINTNKRLTYIILLGAVLCAYWYDIDIDTLTVVMRTVSKEAAEHLPGVDLQQLGFPGLS